MAFAELLARANTAVAQHLGEPCTHIAASGTVTSCSVVLTQAADALDFTAGALVAEQRVSGLIDQAELSTKPAVASVIETAAGVSYSIDDAQDEQGMWRVSLQRMADE